MNFMTLRLTVTSLALFFALIGSAGAADFQPLSGAPLAPMPEPIYRVGTTQTYKWSSNERQRSQKIVAVDESTVSYERRGCNYTIAHHGEFDTRGQSLKWANCGRSRSSGTGKIKLVGKIYPMAIGNSWVWKYSWESDSGRSGGRAIECEVKDQVRVSLPLGDFDTYRVLCQTPYAFRESYISPVLKMIVYTKWEHKTKPRVFYRELVSYELGKSN